MEMWSIFNRQLHKYGKCPIVQTENVIEIKKMMNFLLKDIVSAVLGDT
jgi:hypothetical protein